MEHSIQLKNKNIGPKAPCFIVAEVAQAHDGSLERAHTYIDVVAEAGADAVKFQTHIAAAESTPAEPWRVKFSAQDATRYDYWKRMEFSEAQWRELSDHATERDLVFLSSPFSVEAVELLEQLDMPAWKLGAGEINTLPLIERVAKTGKPILLSSGMSSWEELDRAVEMVRQHHAPYAVYQCTSAYPCPPEKVGLNVLSEIRQRYQCPVGLSDHSGTIYAGLAAVTIGVDMLEVHVTLSREDKGPDVPASVTADELKNLVRGIRFIETAVSNPVDKQAMAKSLTEMKRLFGKSVVAAKDLSKGHRLTHEDLALKKPGEGIPAEKMGELIGRVLSKGVKADTMLRENDLH